jgi:hypothetical protein
MWMSDRRKPLKVTPARVPIRTQNDLYFNLKHQKIFLHSKRFRTPSSTFKSTQEDKKEEKEDKKEEKEDKES